MADEHEASFWVSVIGHPVKASTVAGTNIPVLKRLYNSDTYNTHLLPLIILIPRFLGFTSTKIVLRMAFIEREAHSLG